MWCLAGGGRGSDGSDGDICDSDGDMGACMTVAIQGQAGWGGAMWGGVQLRALTASQLLDWPRNLRVS